MNLLAQFLHYAQKVFGAVPGIACDLELGLIEVIAMPGA